MRKLFVFLFIVLCSLVAAAQPDRWQQHVKYVMDVDVDVQTNRFTGTQKLEYTNNSPDTLWKVFYHLYWNAFQPNSMMDVRSRELGKIRINNNNPDWDPRVRDRIQNLKPDEIGYQKVKWIKMNGVSQTTKEHETILEVALTKPVPPHSKVNFELAFEAQVPLQVRRSGRDNPNTGVRYSMSQWYPKLCEYDYEGWHPTPYIAREFYGVWGDYEVNISIDKNYMLGGSGYLQNAAEIGYGYEAPGSKVTRPAGSKLTWRFSAPNVHDFMWAADPGYKHLTRMASNGRTIHVLYNRDEDWLKKQFDALTSSGKAKYENDVNKYIANWDRQWKQVADAAVIVLPFIESKFGPYPYRQYSFVHGGDGGMEYPMATLISGPSLGTAFHEWMHSWYQMMMGTNESEYAWMDEGFTSFAEALVAEYYALAGGPASTAEPGVSPRIQITDSLAREHARTNIHHDAYNGYVALVKSGLEEPMTTHADHFETNFAYSLASYSKGEVFMEQLGYIVGSAIRDKILLEYYRLWHFKHPNASDFIQVAEKVSGIKLDWYKEYWVNTTKSIDYGIEDVGERNGKATVRIKRIGKMPMPIDLMIEYKDGTKQLFYIPLNLMFGAKPHEDNSVQRKLLDEWKWTDPSYNLQLDRKLTEIKTIEIDPSQRMADVERQNNRLMIPGN